MNHVFLRVDSRPENVPLVGVCAKELANDYFSAEKLSEIEQALVEAVNNCIEHAYSGSVDRQITIKFALSRERLLIEISDHGKGFDPECLHRLDAEFDYDPDDIDHLPEGGFGLKIIKSCMDEVSYRREDDLNVWTLIKYPYMTK